MKNIKDDVFNIIVGKWFNEELNLKINISEINKGWKYLFEYSPNIFSRDREINKDETELLLGQNDDNVVHFSNSLGSWNLIFLSENKFELLNENPISKKVKIFVFERITNIV